MDRSTRVDRLPTKSDSCGVGGIVNVGKYTIRQSAVRLARSTRRISIRYSGVRNATPARSGSLADEVMPGEPDADVWRQGRRSDCARVPPALELRVKNTTWLGSVERRPGRNAGGDRERGRGERVVATCRGERRRHQIAWNCATADVAQLERRRDVKRQRERRQPCTQGQRFARRRRSRLRQRQPRFVEADAFSDAYASARAPPVGGSTRLGMTIGAAINARSATPVAGTAPVAVVDGHDDKADRRRYERAQPSVKLDALPVENEHRPHTG